LQGSAGDLEGDGVTLVFLDGGIIWNGNTNTCFQSTILAPNAAINFAPSACISICLRFSYCSPV